jgi:hypothetical protein
LARASAGSNMPAKMAMIAITTSNSMSVNPKRQALDRRWVPPHAKPPAPSARAVRHRLEVEFMMTLRLFSAEPNLGHHPAECQPQFLRHPPVPAMDSLLSTFRLPILAVHSQPCPMRAQPGRMLAQRATARPGREPPAMVPSPRLP